MGVFCRSIVLLTLLTNLSGCFKEAPEKLAVDFIKNRNYEQLSDEDKKYFTAEEFSEFRWSEKIGLFPASSKYFPLEIHLKNMVTYEVTDVVKNEDETLVSIKKNYPSALDEVLWFTVPPGPVVTLYEEELENLLAAYSGGILTTETLPFSTETEVVTVRDSGVYIDLQKERAYQDMRKRIEKIEASAKRYLDDNKKIRDLALFGYLEEDRFQEIIDLSKNLDEGVTAVENARAQVVELAPDALTYDFDQYLQSAAKIKGWMDSYQSLVDGVTFHNVKIGQARGGELAIFGNFRYKGDVAIKYGNAVALFKDPQGVVIGRQILGGLFRDAHPNQEKGFGYKIKDHHLAQSASSVEVLIHSAY